MRREEETDHETDCAQTDFASFVIFSLLSLEAFSQDKPLKKINWGVTSLSAGNWIPWIAKEAKIYDKHGLDVQLILLRGSGQTSAAILGGSIFASPVTLTTMIMADLSGADFVNVAHTVAAVATKLLVKPDIKRVEDLKGKRVGITSLGSLSDFLLKHTFRKYGLDPNRDITWLDDGHADRAAPGSAGRHGGRRRGVLPDRFAGREKGLSRAARPAQGSHLSVHVDGDPAQNHRRRSRHGRENGSRSRRRDRLLQTEQGIQPARV